MSQSMPFCGECKAMVYPKNGQMICKRCGWEGGSAASKIVAQKASGKGTELLDSEEDRRPQQEAECPKCGHHKAFFHLMQTRRSDEPPTEINQCVACGHSWREY